MLQAQWILKRIVPQLVKRLRLNETPEPDSLLLLPYVAPVVEVSPLLETIELKHTVTAVAANGIVVVATVPPGKLWKLNAYSVLTASGAFNSRYLYVYDKVPKGMIIDIWTAAVEQHSRIDGDIKLPEGWTLRVSITGYSAPGNLNFDGLIVETDNFQLDE